MAIIDLLMDIYLAKCVLYDKGTTCNVGWLEMGGFGKEGNQRKQTKVRRPQEEDKKEGGPKEEYQKKETKRWRPKERDQSS